MVQENYSSLILLTILSFLIDLFTCDLFTCDSLTRFHKIKVKEYSCLLKISNVDIQLKFVVISK